MAKKKVLILAYDFPPYNSIGAQRPASWFNYFHKLGIDPTVITLHWDNDITDDQSYIIPSFAQQTTDSHSEKGREIRVPFKANYRDLLLYKYGFFRFSLLRRLLTLFYYTTKYSLFLTDNTREIYNKAYSLLKEESFDLILATAEPFVLFKYASKLSEKFQVPWVADFRDVWTNNIALENQGRLMRLINYKYFRKLERKYLSNARLITTPSPSYKELIHLLHPNKDIRVVFNGHDVKGIQHLDSIEHNKEVFEVAYSGRVYPHQRLELFLDAYHDFIKVHNLSPKETRIVFYGLDFYHDNKSRALNYKEALKPFILITPRLPYLSMLKKLREASTLLLLSSKSANWLNAKIFDYLVLNRRIMLVENDKGILENILYECKAGKAYESVDQISKDLAALFSEFRQGAEMNHPTVNAERYSRYSQAENISQIILQCVD